LRARPSIVRNRFLIQGRHARASFLLRTIYTQDIPEEDNSKPNFRHKKTHCKKKHTTQLLHTNNHGQKQTKNDDEYWQHPKQAIRR
jgi:hypothetical protein